MMHSAIPGLLSKPARLTVHRMKKASMFAFATFAGVMIATHGNFGHEVVLLAPLCTFVITLGVYLLNDLYDLEVDRANDLRTPLINKQITKTETFAFVIFLDFLGISIAYVLGPVVMAIAFLEILLGVLYSIRPFSFKDRFVVKTLSVGAGGFLANLSGGVASGVINSDLLFSSGMFLIFLLSTSSLIDLADSVGDRSQNRRTIPIVIGEKRTIKLSILTSIVPPICALIFFEMLNFDVLSIALLSLIAARSLQLLLPLLKSDVNLARARKQHNNMFYLLYLLQGALVVASLPL